MYLSSKLSGEYSWTVEFFDTNDEQYNVSPSDVYGLENGSSISLKVKSNPNSINIIETISNDTTLDKYLEVYVDGNDQNESTTYFGFGEFGLPFNFSGEPPILGDNGIGLVYPTKAIWKMAQIETMLNLSSDN